MTPFRFFCFFDYFFLLFAPFKGEEGLLLLFAPGSALREGLGSTGGPFGRGSSGLGADGRDPLLHVIAVLTLEQVFTAVGQPKEINS